MDSCTCRGPDGPTSYVRCPLVGLFSLITSGLLLLFSCHGMKRINAIVWNYELKTPMAEFSRRYKVKSRWEGRQDWPLVLTYVACLRSMVKFSFPALASIEL